MADAPDLGVVLGIAQAAFTEALRTRLAEQGFAGFTPRTGFVLRVLDGGTLSLRELADAMEVSSPAALKTVTTLEEHGYVERVEDADDRRQRGVRATRQGTAAIAAARAFHAEVETSLGELAAPLREALGLIADRAPDVVPPGLRRT